MKLFLAILLIAATHLAAIPASSTLTLVNETGFNRIRITITAGGAPSNDTTTLTGNLLADFNVDPSAHTTSELTMRGGSFNGTNMRFRGILLFFPVYDISLTNLSGTVSTPNPPGLVDPQNGNFDAAQHRFTLDQGQLTGTAIGNSFNSTITPDDPISGPGSGTGTVTLNPTSATATHQDYQVTISLPVAVNESTTLDGVAVTITGTGTIKATGNLSVPKSEFIAWAVGEGIANPVFDQAYPADSVPLGLRWALGLNATEPANPYLPIAINPTTFSLQLPNTRAPLWIETSTDLDEWLPASAARITGNNNPLPPGSQASLTIDTLGNGSEFIRLRAEEP